MPNTKQKSKNESSRKRNPRRSTLQTPFAPVSMAYRAPQPGFRSLPPSEGADARYHGCDFVGQDSSLSASTSPGALYPLAAFYASAFPRLSVMADLFLRYRWKKLVYHFIGRSASTQAGVGAWASFILDANTNSLTVNTEAIIKNAKNALVLKGWESGRHEVEISACGPRWYNNDVDSVPFTPGNLCHFLPQTTANGDLSWDVYVEYDVEFCEPVAGATVTPLFKEKRDRKICKYLQEFSGKQKDANLTSEIEELRKKLRELEMSSTPGNVN